MEQTTILLGLVATWLLYLVLKMLYNVSPLHPLYAVPGPKLAAASYLPEFWHDVVLFGRYTSRIRKMHEKYGPIVRITPDEVHSNDCDFIDEIFPGEVKRKRNKPLHQVRSYLPPESEFATVDHDLHRARRAPSARFFSRSMVVKLEPQIAPLTQQLCDKMLATGGLHEPIDINAAMSNLVTDITSQSCFGESFGLLNHPGFETNFSEPTNTCLKFQYLYKFFPFTREVNKLLPWIVDYLPANIALMVQTCQIDLANNVQKILDSDKTDVDPEAERAPPTIIHAALTSDLRPQDKTLQPLLDRAFNILGAGAETTSWALSVIIYYLLTQPVTLRRLTAELMTVVRDPNQLPSWTELEKLPYLDAVIQEGLRLSYGVSARTARIPTEEDLVYEGVWQNKQLRYTVPRGYAVGMSTAITNHDEALYPNSHKFHPERWIVDPSRRKELDHGHLTFGRGSRRCPGVNLARCVLYYALTAVTLRVMPRMRLFETTERDVVYDHDLLIPMPAGGSKGVRVVII